MPLGEPSADSPLGELSNDIKACAVATTIARLASTAGDLVAFRQEMLSATNALVPFDAELSDGSLLVTDEPGARVYRVSFAQS